MNHRDVPLASRGRPLLKPRRVMDLLVSCLWVCKEGTKTRTLGGDVAMSVGRDRTAGNDPRGRVDHLVDDVLVHTNLPRFAAMPPSGGS